MRVFGLSYMLSLPGVFETGGEGSTLIDVNTKLSHLDCVTDMGQQSPNSLYLIILVCVLYIECLYATYAH